VHAQTLLCDITGLPAKRARPAPHARVCVLCSVDAHKNGCLCGRLRFLVLNNRAISATSGCIISLSGIVTWHVAAFPAELWQGGGCLREHFD